MNPMFRKFIIGSKHSDHATRQEKKFENNKQTQFMVPGNREILRELNETPLEYGSLHCKNQGGWQNLYQATI